MKKLLAVASATLLLSSVAGVSAAHHNDDHTQNHHGMCTADFSGSENGQDNERNNGSAFSSFEDAVEGAENGGDFDDDGDVDAYDVANYCNNATGGFGNPGGGNDAWFGDSDCGEDFEEECAALEDQEAGSNPARTTGTTTRPARADLTEPYDDGVPCWAPHRRVEACQGWGIPFRA